MQRTRPGDQEVAAHLAVGNVLELDRAERALEVAGRGFEGELGHRALAGSTSEVDGLGRVAGERPFAVVVGELVEVLVEVGPWRASMRLADPPVHAHPLGRRELLVERRAHQRVRERVRADRAGHLADDRGARRFVERVEELLARRTTRALDRVHIELRADHRAEHEGLVGGLRQSGAGADR